MQNNKPPKEWSTRELETYIVENGILTKNHLWNLNPTRDQMINLIEKHEIDLE